MYEVCQINSVHPILKNEIWILTLENTEPYPQHWLVGSQKFDLILALYDFGQDYSEDFAQYGRKGYIFHLWPTCREKKKSALFFTLSVPKK